MKRWLSLLLFVTFSMVSLNTLAVTSTSGKIPSTKNAQEVVDLYFFWSTNCPHCVAAHPFLDKLKTQYSWLRIHSYEVSGHSRNSRLFEKMARDHGRETSFVPTFFVGDKMIVGFTSEDTTGNEIRDAIVGTHDKA